MLIWQISHCPVFARLEKRYSESPGICIIPLKCLKAQARLHCAPICCNWVLGYLCETLLYNSILSKGQLRTRQKCSILRAVITANTLRPFGNVFCAAITGITSLMSHLGLTGVFTLAERILNLGLLPRTWMYLTMGRMWEASEKQDAVNPVNLPYAISWDSKSCVF